MAAASTNKSARNASSSQGRPGATVSSRYAQQDQDPKKQLLFSSNLPVQGDEGDLTQNQSFFHQLDQTGIEKLTYDLPLKSEYNDSFIRYLANAPPRLQEQSDISGLSGNGTVTQGVA